VNAPHTVEGAQACDLMRPGLVRRMAVAQGGPYGFVSVPRVVGLDYTAALALAPEGLDRERFVHCLKMAEDGLLDADAEAAQHVGSAHDE
jgi:hypothetical protein